MALIARLRSPSAINTLWVLFGYIIKQGSQLVAFILLVRAIGVDGFGAFSAVLGLAALTSPFVELGGASLIVRDVHQRNFSLKAAIERSIQVSTAIFPIVFILIILLKPFVFPAIPWILVIAVTLAELLGNRIIALFYGLNIAREQLKFNTYIEIMVGLLRLFLVLILVWLGGNSNTWGLFYLTQSIFVSSCIIFFLKKSLKIELKLRKITRVELQESFHFALGSASHVGYSELDKVMLSRLTTLADTGVFASASRIVNLTALALFAVTGALYPKFFGSDGTNPYKLAFRLLPYTLPYGLVAAAVIFFMAPFLANLLGNEFGDVSEALRLLAIISIFNAVHYPLADAVTGSGKQFLRTRFYLISLLTNTLLNLGLIPSLGWRGAGYATLISQVLLVSMLLIHAKRELRRMK